MAANNVDVRINCLLSRRTCVSLCFNTLLEYYRHHEEKERERESLDAANLTVQQTYHPQLLFQIITR